VLLGCHGTLGPAGTWYEVSTDHFRVASGAGEGHGRRVAEQFEQMRAVFRLALPEARVESAQLLTIVAVGDEDGLRELLPEFWEEEGGKRPVGIFVPGPERNYVALRVDGRGESPYRVVYHEYVHHLLRLNFLRLPLWLNEGLAEFYGNTSFSAGKIRVGRASPGHLETLRRSGAPPLEALLSADRSSPLYNSAEKAPSFYAEAWLLTHYLLLGARGANKPTLYEYLRLLDQGVGDLEAARRAFGGLERLKRSLDRYRRQGEFFYLPLPPPQADGREAPRVRPMSPAEVAAVLGGIHLHLGHRAAAASHLEEALELDPGLTDALVDRALLADLEGRPGQAWQLLGRAMQLAPDDPLAPYYRARLALRGAPVSSLSAQAEADLLRSRELLPGFAPATSELAFLYAVQGDRPEQALQLARQAVHSEPGSLRYQFVLAQVLSRSGRVKEAEALGVRILAAAGERQRPAVDAFLRGLRARQPKGE
jgi:tetratricopeptide (TPR) repeat protein